MGLEAWAGFPHRIDSRWLLLGCLTFVIAVVLTPLGAWNMLGGQAVVLAFVLGIFRVDSSKLTRRYLALCPLLILLGFLLGLSHPGRSSLGPLGVALAIIARNSLALLAVLSLGLVYPAVTLIQALRRLGCPPVVVTTLHFMHRYAHVLSDERDRMLVASQARSFGRRRSLWSRWSMLGNLLGSLCLRAMERGERVHTAMISRGWDGTIRSLADAEETP